MTGTSPSRSPFHQAMEEFYCNDKGCPVDCVGGWGEGGDEPASTCPPDFPHTSTAAAHGGKICYAKNSYAAIGSGPCASWCTKDKKLGSGCGDPASKLCCPPSFPYTSHGGKICYTTKAEATKGSGPCESWCTNDASYGSGCGDPVLKLCSKNRGVSLAEGGWGACSKPCGTIADVCLSGPPVGL